MGASGANVPRAPGSKGRPGGQVFLFAKFIFGWKWARSWGEPQSKNEITTALQLRLSSSNHAEQKDVLLLSRKSTESTPYPATVA